MERSSWTLIILAAFGAAALVLAWVPSAWPNPLDGVTPSVRAERMPQLEGAAAAVDAACRDGNAKAFAQVTTASYRLGLEQRLDAVEATLTGQTLQAMAAGAPAYREWFQQPIWALEAVGSYAAVVVARQGGDGAQMLMFAWDGAQFRLDEVRHVIRVTGPEVARPFVRELLQAR